MKVYMVKREDSDVYFSVSKNWVDQIDGTVWNEKQQAVNAAVICNFPAVVVELSLT